MNNPKPVPEYALELINITKTYKPTRQTPAKIALSNINLNVPRGSIFGLLGPNGAGKSTLINILAGLTIKSSGTAKIWGYEVDKDARSARSAIGVVPQELNLDAFFTPYELLELQAGLYGLPKKERQTDALLKAVDLSDKANSYARTLSGGMRRRLMVAKAMVHSPPVLILDEPTAGVDVELRKSLWKYVRALNESGTTILLTTHYLEEAEELCDRIAIINKGELVAHDTKTNLLKRIDNKSITFTLEKELAELPQELSNQNWHLTNPHQLTVSYQPSITSITQLLDQVRKINIIIVDLTTHDTDLEDIFLQLTHSKS